jgi:hypothetical protein
MRPRAQLHPGAGGKRPSHRDLACLEGPNPDLPEQEHQAPWTSLHFSRNPPGLGGLQGPGARLHPPALQGPTSLHLPSTPLAHPHPLPSLNSLQGP